MLLEATRRCNKLCDEADNLSFSPNIITTINPSLCLKTEAYSASENLLDNTNNRTSKSAPLWHFMKLWTGTLRRAALMLCIREVSNSNYGRETVYQEDFVVWRRLSRKIPRRYLKFAYDHFQCSFFSRRYSPTMQSYSPPYWQRREMKYVTYVHTQASLTTLIYA
jgi:hypothetical protein